MSQQDSAKWAVAAALIGTIGFVLIMVVSEGNNEQLLGLFMTGLMGQVFYFLKEQKATKTAVIETDKKVDELLNGSLQGKITALEERVSNIEQLLTRALAKMDETS